MKSTLFPQPLAMITKFLIIFLLFASCSAKDPNPAQILVSVSNECICNVFIYSPDGLCLQSKIWDCQETKQLIFNIYYEGALTVKAEYKEKSASQTITTHFGKSTEVSIFL